MSAFNRLILISIPALVLASCQPNPEDILSKHKKKIGDISSIENITTKALCKGPDGSYVTLTSSSFTDDYLLFQQSYSYRFNPFNAVIYELGNGIGLDSALLPKGSLSKPVIGVLKAHEFHELMLQVDQRYQNFEMESDTVFFGADCVRIKATDPLDLTVHLFFNKKSGLMEGFTQVNPYKRSERIQVHFQEWEERDGIMIFDKLTILQGSEARFTFDYELVIFNEPTFAKYDPPALD